MADIGFCLFRRTWASVMALRERISPAAVAGFIVPVDIDAIDGIARERFWPHVVHEGRKGVLPFIAHTDASRAVVLVAMILWIGTTLSHIAPREIFGGQMSTVGMAVASRSPQNTFAFQASTAYAFAKFHVAAINDSGLTAVAPTRPIRFQRLGLGAADNEKASVSLSRNIDQSRHTSIVSQAWQTLVERLAIWPI